MANVVPKTKNELMAEGWGFSEEASQYNVYAWGGAITPDSEIGELIFPTMFVATAVGQYDNCGGIFVSGPEVHLLIYENDEWRLENVSTFDAQTYVDKKTSRYVNLQEVGGVYTNPVFKIGTTVSFLTIPVVDIENPRYVLETPIPGTTEAEEFVDDVSFDQVTLRFILRTSVDTRLKKSSFEQWYDTAGLGKPNFNWPDNFEFESGKVYDITFIPMATILPSYFVSVREIYPNYTA